MKGSKRILIWLLTLTLVLVVGIMHTDSGSLQAGFNELPLSVNNNGFEEPLPGSGITGWTLVHTGGVASVSDDQPYSGSNSLKLFDSSTSAALSMESDPITALTGNVYEAQAQIYVASGSARLYIRFWDATSTLLGSSFTNTTTTGQWEEVFVSATAPVGTHFVSVLLQTPELTAGTAYFDEIYLSTERDMLIPNFSFENFSGTTPTDWTLVHGGGTAAVSSDKAFSGSYSLKLVDTRTDLALSMQSSRIAAVAGEKYTAQARIYVESGGAQLYVRFFDSTNAYISASFANTPGTGAWKNVSITGTAPANAAYVSVMLIIPTATTGTAYYDDITISKRITNLGPQMTSVVSHGAVFGFDENNDPVIYAVLDGSANTPPMLAVIDYNTDMVTRLVTIGAANGGSNPAWAVTYSSDGKVYMGILNMTNGALYRYTPGDTSVESLGVPAAGSNMIFDLKPGPNGEIYVGTYSNATLYKYEDATGFTVLGSSPMVAGETYVRGVAYDPTYEVVYAGIGANAHLIRVALDTNTTEDVLPSAYSTEAFAYDLHYRDGKLFVRLSPSSTGIVLDITEDVNGDAIVTLDHEIPNLTSLGITSVHDNKVYFTSNKEVQSYNLVIQTITSLGTELPINPIEIEIVELEDQIEYPGHTVIGVGSTNGQLLMVKYNLANDDVEIVPLSLPGSNATINYVEKGPNNTIYTGGFLNGGLGAYSAGRSDYTQQFKGIGQPESMYEYNNKLYLGIYPGAGIYEYDPTSPWTISSGGNNPKLLFSVGSNQDRPYSFTSGANKLFVGTAPKYGELGGALVIYDPVLGGTPTVENHIVSDQSVIALTYKDGKVYGGTSIWGGLGTTPTATSAALFIYDVATGTKTSEIIPVAGKKAITDVIVGPDGNIWGMAEGYLFIYSPTLNSIIYSADKFPAVSYTIGSPVLTDAKMLVAKDNHVYLKIRNGLYKIDASTKAVSNIAVGTNIRGLTQDDFGNLYFYWRDNLYRYSF